MYFRRLYLALLTLLLTASPLSAQIQKNAGNWAEWWREGLLMSISRQKPRAC